MSEVVETIVRQLSCQGLDKLTLACLGFKTFVKMDDDTLRLHFKDRRGVVNVDVHYNIGYDSYDVTYQRIDRETYEIKSRIRKDVFFDELAGVFDDLFAIKGLA